MTQVIKASPRSLMRRDRNSVINLDFHRLKDFKDCLSTGHSRHVVRRSLNAWCLQKAKEHKEYSYQLRNAFLVEETYGGGFRTKVFVVGTIPDWAK